MRSTTTDPRAQHRSTDVDLALETLRGAASDLGYTVESLEAATGKDGAHISRVFNGLKPLTFAFFSTLPFDLRSLFYERRAAQHGLIVVRPLSGAEAQRAFVAGFLGLLTSSAVTVPLKMARASVPDARAAAVNE